MQDGKQLSTTSKGVAAIAVRDVLASSPVALRMFERMPNEIPTKAIEAVLKIDQDIKTAAQSVRSLEPSVSRFASVYGERALAALVLSHLSLVEDMANVARPMKPEGIAMLAKEVTKMLMEEDVAINLADLQIVADRLIKGEAGQIFGGLNSQIVIKAFTDYIREKAGEIVEWRMEKAREHSFGDFGAERGGTAQLRERMKNVAALAAYNDGAFKKDIKTTDQ